MESTSLAGEFALTALTFLEKWTVSKCGSGGRGSFEGRGGGARRALSYQGKDGGCQVDGRLDQVTLEKIRPDILGDFKVGFDHSIQA